MSYRLIRLDAYFLSHTNWVEIGRFNTVQEATRHAESLYYKDFSPSDMKANTTDLAYQLDLTLFWMPSPDGSIRSYFTMHNQPYTANFIVLPTTIDGVAQTVALVEG